MRDVQPPRLARWLLRRALPPGVRGDTILGDLLEEARARSDRPQAAAFWYWREALSLCARYGFARIGPRRAPAATDINAFPENRPMWLESTWQDLRYAVRAYAKTPAFTVAILTTLALGIGASTAIFSMLNAILLRPLPFPEPERVLFINEINFNGSALSVSWPNFVDWRARVHSIDLAASRTNPFTLTGREQARLIDGRRVTANFFAVLGTPPVVGRNFVADDDRVGAAPVAIVSDAFSRRQFGGDRAALGQTLVLDNQTFTVVGVLPRTFRYLRDCDVFAAMGPFAASRNLLERGNHAGYFAIGRLKPNVTRDAASVELQTIEAGIARAHPDDVRGITVGVQTLSSRLTSDVRQTLLVLFGAVGCLLLIACVNVANLLIARGAARQHELALRAALGGGRLRIAGQLLAESALVSTVGGALGIALAAGLLRMLVAVAPEGTPRLDEVRLDAMALLFALGAAAACGLLFGALPAFQASGVSGQEVVIRGRAAGASARSHRLRRGLLAVEVALALMLLAGAGLMIRTLGQLASVDTGFRADHLLTMQLPFRGERYDEPHRVAFLDDLLARTRALPGVANAAAVSYLPIDGSSWNSVFAAEGRPVPASHADLPQGAMTPATVGYFETMGTQLVRGRVFTAADRAQSTAVAIVNETLARRMWPGEDPIGKRLKPGWPEMPGKWWQVVGVVADVKVEGITEPTPMQMYMPFTQAPDDDVALVVRTSIEPAALAAPVEALVHSLDRDMPVSSVRTMDHVLQASIARQRMAVLVLAMFACVALTLASVGLYGIVSHGVAERMHEIGIRMALGAEARQVVALVVSQGLATAVAGTVMGLGGALALTRSIRGLLFGVSATDPATFGAVVALLFVVTIGSCYLPARRATRVDPTTALRTE